MWSAIKAGGPFRRREWMISEKYETPPRKLGRATKPEKKGRTKERGIQKTSHIWRIHGKNSRSRAATYTKAIATGEPFLEAKISGWYLKGLKTLRRKGNEEEKNQSDNKKETTKREYQEGIAKKCRWRNVDKEIEKKEWWQRIKD